MKLGQIEVHENANIGKRDAFHVACVLCTMDEDAEGEMIPGMPVRFMSAAFSEVRPIRPNETPHGVIDPFLNAVELKRACGVGDQFLVMLYPGMSSSPRHDFQVLIEPDGDMSKSTWNCRNCN